MTRTFPRRVFHGLVGAFAAALALPAQARSRIPAGGSVALHLPWSTTSLDPHDLSDPLAALLGPALFDPLYALDGAGAPYPALADGAPVARGAVTVVRLREGLRTARGRALDGRDVVASVQRARSRGAAAWLAPLSVPTVDPNDARAVRFSGVGAEELAQRLASPLLALVPRGFSANEPDGTGAFRATLGATTLRLERNTNAARGAAFLDAVSVTQGTDLRESLRAFESRTDDVGWLGAGLYDTRKGAVRFDFGAVAYVVLVAGAGVGAAASAGALQSLCDGLPGDRLRHLGLGALPTGTGVGWAGPPTELWVDGAAPHLVEIADAVAPLLTRPGHEVTVRRVSRAEVARFRASGQTGLALTLVAPLDPTPLGLLVALATLDEPTRAVEVVKHPPRFTGPTPPSTLARSLRLGVLGELRVAGAVREEVALRGAASAGWDLAASHWRARP